MSGSPEPWLTPSGAPAPGEVARRVTWWEAREQAARAGAPPLLLEALASPRRPPPGGRACWEVWLPVGPLRREVLGLLQVWFGDALQALGAELSRSSWTGCRSWLDACRDQALVEADRWPSATLRRLETAAGAAQLLAAAFDPRREGVGWGRYPARREELLRALGPRARIRAWDAGAGTGEGSWELARDLLELARRVEVIGSDACPVRVRLAQLRRIPHAPERQTRLEQLPRQAPALADPGRCQVRFLLHDVRAAPPVEGLDLVACHGLLGGAIRDEAELRGVVAGLAGALGPGGILSVTDRFREDRAAWAREAVGAAAAAAGLEPLEVAGLFRRPG